MMIAIHRSKSSIFTLSKNFFSTYIKKEPLNSLAVSNFLVQKHQFSPESASKIATALTNFKNTGKSDAVISFMKESGFSKAQVERILTGRPALLTASVDKIIRPKIKIFENLGFSPAEFTKIIAKDPIILCCSAKNRVIPSLSVLKSLLGSNSEVSKLLKISGWFLIKDLEKTLIPNVKLLESNGVPTDQIVKHIFHFPRFLLHSPETMKKSVAKAEELGVSKSSKVFIYAVRIVSSMSNEIWDVKLQAFLELGFSKKEVLRVFKKTPQVFSVSEEKMKNVAEFLLGTGKYNMLCIVNSPRSLMYSLEKRYRPRIKVLDILEKENLIKEWPSLSYLCLMSEAKFFKRFVGPYLSEVGAVYTDKSSSKRRYVKC